MLLIVVQSSSVRWFKHDKRIKKIEKSVATTDIYSMFVSHWQKSYASGPHRNVNQTQVSFRDSESISQINKPSKYASKIINLLGSHSIDIQPKPNMNFKQWIMCCADTGYYYNMKLLQTKEVNKFISRWHRCFRDIERNIFGQWSFKSKISWVTLSQ